MWLNMMLKFDELVYYHDGKTIYVLSDNNLPCTK